MNVWLQWREERFSMRLEEEEKQCLRKMLRFCGDHILEIAEPTNKKQGRIRGRCFGSWVGSKAYDVHVSEIVMGEGRGGSGVVGVSSEEPQWIVTLMVTFMTYVLRGMQPVCSSSLMMEQLFRAQVRRGAGYQVALFEPRLPAFTVPYDHLHSFAKVGSKPEPSIPSPPYFPHRRVALSNEPKTLLRRGARKKANGIRYEAIQKRKLEGKNERKEDEDEGKGNRMRRTLQVCAEFETWRNVIYVWDKILEKVERAVVDVDVPILSAFILDPAAQLILPLDLKKLIFTYAYSLDVLLDWKRVPDDVMTQRRTVQGVLKPRFNSQLRVWNI